MASRDIMDACTVLRWRLCACHIVILTLLFSCAASGGHRARSALQLARISSLSASCNEWTIVARNVEETERRPVCAFQSEGSPRAAPQAQLGLRVHPGPPSIPHRRCSPCTRIPPGKVQRIQNASLLAPEIEKVVASKIDQ
jgi:hypothetical protein